MGAAKVITDRKLPEHGEVVEAEENHPALSAAVWFRAGVTAYEGQKQCAADLEVVPGYLTQQCSGSKPVHIAHLERMRRGNVVAFQRVVEQMAFSAKMLVVASGDLRLTGEERALLLATRDLLGPNMWPAYRDKLAARVFRCGGDLLDHALNYEAFRNL